MLLCMVCLSTLSIQRSKHANALNAMFVETDDTKDQSNAIVYGMFINTVDTKIKTCKCIECYVCRDCRYTVVCGSYTTPYTEYYEV